MGNTIEFDNFEEAKTAFISKLEHFVESTRKGLKIGFSPYYSSPLWDEKEGHQKMRDEAKERLELLLAIQELGYESLRYSVFSEQGLSEWETRIEFNNETEKYEVYLTRDRSGKGKIFEYTNFEEAKEKFMELLEHTVSRNKYYISNGWAPQYPSPLWDEKEDHQKLRDEAEERLELLSTIQDLGYESLRYSIFNDHRPREWETRIEYNPELELYEVYSTMDRASAGGIFKFKTFEEAKEKFIHNLKLAVFINKTSVENGEVPEYSSPLWEKIDD